MATTQIAPIDAPPVKRLKLNEDAEAVAQSVEDLAVALCELAWLDSRIATEEAKLEQEIRVVKQAAENRQQIRVGRKTVSYQDRREQLVAAVTRYCEAHPDEIKQGNSKTRKFTHGEIALRQTPLSVAPAEGKTWNSVVDAVRRKGLRRFLQIKHSIIKTRIVSEVRDDKLTEGDLFDLNLVAQQPRDEVKVKPSRYTLDPPSALDA